ncbi:family 43 glycosylhydrolase [Lysobacter korlensis]|uniref:Family 43 glycosylhydrolase n=1 Tax=Lysobacter korlensis TaxID=553636 RepID=A0ABV6RUG0_9GAMM
MKTERRITRAVVVAAAMLLGAGLITPASAAPPSGAQEVDIDPAGQLPLTGNLNLHDPTIYKDGDTYYAAATHRGIWSSPSLEGPWTNIGSVTAAPWTSVAGYSVWAPHVQKIGDTFYYYYSISGFGSNNSAIGLKTTKTPGIPSSYVDHGAPIVASGTLSEDNATFNAIDPALEQDEDGNWWMVWGSHFDGIFIQQLDSDMVTLVGERYKVADRESEAFPIDNPNFNRIEGPSVFKHGDWYYLLTAWDWCCRGNGNDNTYKIVAGRSKNIQGPYVDKNGVDLAEGGGTIILNSRQAQPGVTPSGLHRAPGAPDYFWEGDTLYMSYHSYRPGTVMGIRPINWDGGWPFFYEPGGGPYDIRDNGIYQLRMQGGSIASPGSLQNPTASNSCLEAGDGDVQLAACADAIGQYWMLEREGDGFYRWRSLAGDRDLYLTMENLSGTIGTPVGLEPLDGSDRQLWYFDDTGHGFHRLTGKGSNLSLEVENTNGVVGTEIVGSYRRDGDHQAGNLTQAAKWPPQQWRIETIVDDTAPEVTASLDQQQRIVVDATDDIAGVALIEYRVDKKNKPADGWITLDGPIRTDAASVVTIRATDAAGNVSEELEVTLQGLRG